MLIRRAISTALLAAMLAVPTESQTTDPLFRSWEWADEPHSARAAALSGAVAAAASDASSAALHPAALSLVSETDIRLSVRYEGSGSIELDRQAEGWTFSEVVVSQPIGRRSGVAAYHRSRRWLSLDIVGTPFSDGSSDEGQVEAKLHETGIAFGTALTPKLRLGARLGAAHLRLDGRAATRSTDGSVRATASLSDGYEPSLGVGLLLAPHQRFETGLTWDAKLSGGAARTGEPSLSEHELVVPPRLAWGLLYRPSSVVWIMGQLDWVGWSQVRSALGAPPDRPPAGDFELDDAVEGRLGLELRGFYGERPLQNRMIVRFGMHVRSRGLLRYGGEEATERERFPGGGHVIDWSVGVAFGPIELAWVSRQPSNVWVFGVRQLF